jgi:hypothetical protein
MNLCAFGMRARKRRANGDKSINDPGAGELVYGLIFWFRWNKFPGSYFLLIATSRS